MGDEPQKSEAAESEESMESLFPVLKRFISDARSFLRIGEAKVDKRTEDFCKESRNALIEKMVLSSQRESMTPPTVSTDHAGKVSFALFLRSDFIPVGNDKHSLVSI